ncbi:MAG: SMI1/KNR4 family protein [Planctomycetaceae bacterium]
MNDVDLAKIEKATGLTLPAAYATLLRKFPAELLALLKFDEPDERMLFTDARTIVRWNKFFRKPDYEYENSSGEICQFPSNHIVIGANSGGDFYHIDTRRKRTAVLFWCHETGEFTECAKHLDAFIREIFSCTADGILYVLDLK